VEVTGGSKGGQTVLLTDVDRIRVRAYMHRHKLHQKQFNLDGPNEVATLCDRILEMVDDGELNDDGTTPRRIFSEPPHTTWDNFFSGDQTMEYIASKGLGITCTVNQGRLPSKVPGQHWHKAKLSTNSDDRCKAARFENPIVAVKRNKKKWGTDSVWMHTSFQSTGACNIAHVNALNHCSLCAQQKARGHALFKRQWAIEMNKSRYLYLHTYGKVDKIDHMIKNCNMYYRYVLLL